MSRVSTFARAASVTVLGLAGIGMVARGAWPLAEESLMFGLSVVCLYGVLRSVSTSVRLVLAATWVGAVVWLSGSLLPPQTWLDFKTFVDGAELLYGEHQSPYRNAGTTAFPFPTFAMVRAMNLNGRVPFETTAWMFSVLQVALLALSYALMRQVMLRDGMGVSSDVGLALIQAGLLFHPAVMLGLYYGQSSIVAGTFVLVAVWCWRCRSHGAWRHVAAISLNLAWMIKPQLLMAAGFFGGSWLYRSVWARMPLCSEAAIGRLLAPWCGVLILMSLALDFHGHVAAYQDFVTVAARWHGQIAETYPNNYAGVAILAKAGARFADMPIGVTLPILSALGAGIILTWNVMGLRVAAPGSLDAFLPWLVASLLWTPLVWRFYLGSIIAGLLLLLASTARDSIQMPWWKAMWLAAGVGLTMVLSSFAFTLGIILVYLFSTELLASRPACDEHAQAPPGRPRWNLAAAPGRSG